MSKHVLVGSVIKPRKNCDVCKRPADVSFQLTKDKTFLCSSHAVQHLKRQHKNYLIDNSTEEKRDGR